jgi:hypothetical protein
MNPEKCIGSRTPYYRSSWEARLMYFFDTNTSVMAWGSEVLAIPYVDPFTNRVRDYVPDFVVRYQDRTGTIITEIVEVKPENETTLESARTDADRAAVQLNAAKWQAAAAYAESNGAKFRVIGKAQIYQTMPRQRRRPTPRR